MKISGTNLVGPDQRVTHSGVYAGYVILKHLSKKGELNIFDLYKTVQKKIRPFNYGATIQGLVFLKMLGIIEFKSPVIKVVSQNGSAQ